MHGVRFLDCNPSTLRMFGCNSKQDIVGQTPFAFSPALQPDGEPSVDKGGRLIAATLDGVPQHFEWRHCRLDRSEFDVDVRLNRFLIGGQLFLIAVVRDITARKRAEEALRRQLQAEELINRIIARCAGCPPNEVDANVELALRELVDFLGADHAWFIVAAPDRATYSCTHEFCGPGVAPLRPRFQRVPVGAHAEIEATMLTGRTQCACENEVDDPGRRSLLLVPTTGTSGTCAGALGVDSHTRVIAWPEADVILCKVVGNSLTAVVERERARARLVEEKEFSDRIIDCLPGIFYLYDADLRLRRWNKNHEKVLGYSAEELRGKSIRDWHVTDEDQRRSEAAVRSVFERTPECGTVFLESDLVCKDGSRIPYLLSGIRFDSPSGPMLVGVGIDLSERRRAERAQEAAEQALRKTEEQLRQAQKMEAIGRFAGGIAHDFNNMLTVVVMFTSILMNGVRPGDPMMAALEEIKKAADRSTALTRRLLAFSRQQVLDLRVLDLNEIVRGMEDMIRRLVGADIRVVTTLDASLGRAKADAGQIEQSLMNLVVNARDAMPDGGTLTIETHNVDLDERYAREHLGATPGRYVMLAVGDTGLGMDAATQARVFEPYFTTKPSGKGTGLGLAMVFGIVKQSDGHIGVYSEPGKGTTFKIYLPRTDESGVAAAPAAPVTLTTLRGSETILLVEDDDAIRRAVRGVLEENGYRVLEASNGGEALLICEQHPGTIPLLLTDVVLPRLNGRQVAERLVALRPKMKVVFMSGYSENVLFRGGMLEGGISFLQKPITPEALLRKLREVLATSSS